MKFIRMPKFQCFKFILVILLLFIYVEEAGLILNQNIIINSNSEVFENKNLSIIKPTSSAIPEPPILDSIFNPDNDGNYNVIWNEVENATSYQLYRDTSSISDVSGLTPIYELNLTNHYDGIVTFNDTTIGSINPFIDKSGSQHQAYTGVIDEYLGHKKVLEFDFVSSGTSEYLEYNFTQQSPTTGIQSIEFSTILGDYIVDEGVAYYIHGESYETESFYVGHSGGSSHEWYLRSGGTSWQILDTDVSGNEQYADLTKWIDIKIDVNYEIDEVRVYFNGNDVFNIPFSSMPDWDDSCAIDVIDIGSSWGGVPKTYLDSLSWSWHPDYYSNISFTPVYEANNTGHYKGSETWRDIEIGGQDSEWSYSTGGSQSFIDRATVQDYMGRKNVMFCDADGVYNYDVNIERDIPNGILSDGVKTVEFSMLMTEKRPSSPQDSSPWGAARVYLWGTEPDSYFTFGYQPYNGQEWICRGSWDSGDTYQIFSDMPSGDIWYDIRIEIDDKVSDDEIRLYNINTDEVYIYSLGTTDLSIVFGDIDRIRLDSGWGLDDSYAFDSICWDWDPDYEVGDLIEIDSSFELNYTEQNMPNGDYYYVVVATNELGSSDISNCVSVTIGNVPDAPVLETIPSPDNDGNYNITWNGVENATEYHLYRDTSSITDISGLTPIYKLNNSGHYKGSETFREYNIGDTGGWSEILGTGNIKVIDSAGETGKIHKKVINFDPSSDGYYTSYSLPFNGQTGTGIQYFEFWSTFETYNSPGQAFDWAIEDQNGNVLNFGWRGTGHAQQGWQLQYLEYGQSWDANGIYSTNIYDGSVDNIFDKFTFKIDYTSQTWTIYKNGIEKDSMSIPVFSIMDSFILYSGREISGSVFIDSLSWSWDPDYEVGDLLEVDSSFELNYTEQNMPNGDYYYAMVATNEFGSSDISNCVSVTVSSSLGFPIPEILIISIVIVVLLVIGISIIILYKKKGKISRSKKTKKSVDLTAEKIKKLSNLFLMSKNVRIESVAKMLGLTHVELLTFLIENRTTLKGLVIDGDYITMAETSDVNEFVGFLDKQFESWQNKEKTADGKKI